jgi:Cdc6-like AAA superfamily ATPase
MSRTSNIFQDLKEKQGDALSGNGDQKYTALGLRFNPFPKSGTTNINSSDTLYSTLVPVDEKVYLEVINFIKDSLRSNTIDKKDKFICATITGDYGSGKTQLLMFVKYILSEIETNQELPVRPYVIYIDNPGVKLSELIGSIISKIGEENFKKFVWEKVISRIKNQDSEKAKLDKYVYKGGALFDDGNSDPFAFENTVSYKRFLDAFLRYLVTSKTKKKEFEDAIREVILNALAVETGNQVISQYFYDIISEDYGVNKTWEALSSGSIRQLERKETDVIKFIVQLIKDQGYSDFFILVDEFEDVTAGRLTKVQVDNYVYNLRTLLDEHREWSLMFAMTSEALKKLRSVSPPLADRITSRQILLQSLSDDQAKQLIKSHLGFAKTTGDSHKSECHPFSEEAIIELNNKVSGNSRTLLRLCFQLLERFSESNPDGTKQIDTEFIQNIQL